MNKNNDINILLEKSSSVRGNSTFILSSQVIEIAISNRMFLSSSLEEIMKHTDVSIRSTRTIFQFSDNLI